MKAIFEPRISQKDGKFIAPCVCGKIGSYASKASAIRMLSNGSCRGCKKGYISVKDVGTSIYKRADNKWCCLCSGCNSEQAYTRKDHARQSSASDWQCKSCSARLKKYNQNKPVGDKTRIYNRFRKAAYSRGIDWNLTEQEMFETFNGYCSMTGWPISLIYSEHTASLDRVDSKSGYTISNIQWVHTMVNMAKNKYDAVQFVEMCKAVAAKEKW
jgi:hypothetical protein